MQIEFLADFFGSLRGGKVPDHRDSEARPSLRKLSRKSRKGYPTRSARFGNDAEAIWETTRKIWTLTPDAQRRAIETKDQRHCHRPIATVLS